VIVGCQNTTYNQISSFFGVCFVLSVCTSHSVPRAWRLHSHGCALPTCIMESEERPATPPLVLSPRTLGSAVGNGVPPGSARVMAAVSTPFCDPQLTPLPVRPRCLFSGSPSEGGSSGDITASPWSVQASGLLRSRSSGASPDVLGSASQSRYGTHRCCPRLHMLPCAYP